MCRPNSDEGITKNILEEQQKVEQVKNEQEREIAINTIVELILIYGDGQVKKVKREPEDIKRYRAMLCVA